jgi:hypothetical protein
MELDNVVYDPLKVVGRIIGRSQLSYQLPSESLALLQKWTAEPAGCLLHEFA